MYKNTSTYTHIRINMYTCIMYTHKHNNTCACVRQNGDTKERKKRPEKTGKQDTGGTDEKDDIKGRKEGTEGTEGTKYKKGTKREGWKERRKEKQIQGRKDFKENRIPRKEGRKAGRE